ncbi:MAG: hypothetical protein KatS3mg076_0116 [Candidatus Binatia bacterium]|nr:MAG: hypothetical protein KatS3mg076_0116 [Candidatus Binatia bacterium]
MGLFFLFSGAAAISCRGSPAVVLELPGGEAVRVRVEVADTPEKRSLGLMYRKSLPAGTGMLFLFPDEEDHAFWMKNTWISLDMVFIDAHGTVVGVVPDARPGSTESLRVGTPSRYVLEVPAGFARRHGIGPGTRVRFENVPLDGVR